MEISTRPFFGEIDPHDLKINENELKQRLQSRNISLALPLISECQKKLCDAIKCRFAAIKVPISYLSENMIDLTFFKVKSNDLYKNLHPCKNAYIFAVTLGTQVDILLNRLAITSISEHFCTDALASTLSESACDSVEEIIKQNEICRVRFSPGYGDLPLDIQPNILSALNAQKQLGVTLTKSLLMSPSKSITAIMGVE